ncbi:wax ester/triacylglycerol synthase family O-acyltransferase [Nocardia sp. CDC159]|uniref:Diacylglycerol O-acyltransferase n=1 Tax=Nocardia pulmonis TaxID=2951408 RepID=A0A9X2E3Q2_9NOCA|nr:MULTISPECIES: wax ester/triacylglycerol synthase family O-acyltransferase [Nocardia]MCM6773091.1 wax ester/triacylglycerol synthase family O-acyltransferase [Nocardia pulmonis]MCM6785606.1 wax ester/triacylglycerol synthase family O-acyltransferase [Nocardia sp. CDC159]
MDLLNPIDAIFLAAESREHPMHVGGLQIFEPPTDAGADFARSLYDELLTATDVRPRFRRQPRRILGNFSSMVWSHADRIDLGYHVRRCALPAPGGDKELLDLVGRLHSSLLDRHRPLWEGRLIEGLAGDRFAVYIKVHHALMDGVSALRLLQRTLTEDPLDTRLRAPWTLGRAEREPNEPPNVWDQLRKAAPRLITGVGASASALRAVREGRLELPMSAPPTMFNVPIGGARSVAVGSIPLERIHAVRSATGTTVNDVVLALSAAALRAYLLERNALPDKPLTAMVPVNLRSAAEPESDGNMVAALLCNLGTHVADPVLRLQTISGSMRRSKEVFTQLPRLEAIALSALLLSPLPLVFVPGFQSLPRVPFNLVISNVPGPRKPVYVHGARLDRNYPLSIPFDGQAMNITVTSTADNLDFGIVGCRRSVPRLADLVGHIETALRDLERATA